MIGKRTLTGIAAAAIPSRFTIVLAILAIAAAISLHVAAGVAALIDTRVGAKAHQFASTIEAMPLWVFIGGSMSQVASRLTIAWDDGKAWLKRERVKRQIRREEWLSSGFTSDPFSRPLDLESEADLRLTAERK